ncbi:alginate export family protein [Novosphingobium taihuense]|uniref:Alginate export domain-containing protein n=1 Tax=Novosphingobium taihuense TaxID=260085 RepID=A0A7W7EV77_9SPHN|nr:alginate export family protein [Novosphingobium taihuense]MBB4612995.1 hypothetical protein [Novosphingobium taihuense]TWH85139.1 alginate export protein [Novosphingobium taihuense]
MIRHLLVLTGLACATPALANAPERTNLRYDEDWSLQPAGLKNLPLDEGGAVRLTLGLEMRARQESYANSLWGDAPDDGYLWLRMMPLADLHAGPVRAFVQPIVGFARGVKGGNGPADETGVDLLQGFADLNLPLGEDSRLTLRGGRELVALGSERLVGTRYGPNIPQPFDGVRATANLGRLRLDLMNLRAVQIGPGDFDDHASDRRRLRAVYATLSASPDLAFDLYWIGYRNQTARFGAVTGEERRDTFGLRLFGHHLLGPYVRLAWNWETMIQRGAFAGQRIRAWSQATETAISFPDVTLQPRLRLRANYASGDKSPDDRVLGTFNALFPKGRYFGELTPIGPRNIFNVNPGIDIHAGGGFTVEVSAASFWRASLRDGIYDVPGSEIRPAGTSSARHIGNQIGWAWNGMRATSCRCPAPSQCSQPVRTFAKPVLQRRSTWQGSKPATNSSGQAAGMHWTTCSITPPRKDTAMFASGTSRKRKTLPSRRKRGSHFQQVLSDQNAAVSETTTVDPAIEPVPSWPREKLGWR